MRALAIVHQRDAGPGVFEEAALAQGVDLDTWLVAESAEPPREIGEYGAVLSFGGGMHADQELEHPWLVAEKALLAELLHRETSLLGVCLGAQLLGEAAGSPARRLAEPEIGWYQVEVDAEGASDPVMGPMQPGFRAFQWHSYEVPLPVGAVALARSPACVQAWRLGQHAWGIQFHAEVSAADADGWIVDYHVDPDAVRIGLDHVALRAQTREHIGEWNRLGRELCARFLDVAARRSDG